MVARADTPRLTPSSASPASQALTIAAVGGVGAGVAVAIGCLAAPADYLETLVVRSGVAALVNAAASPLGLTARAVLATGGGVLVAAVVWAVLVLVAGDRRLPAAVPWVRRTTRVPGAPSVRRADSHPDAPPRPPIRAERDLGVPFLSIVAAAEPVRASDERALPADLNTALSALDPAAIPDVPREPIRSVPALATVAAPPRPASPPPLAPGERIDSIELGADVRERPDTIESLLARLERGARRRPMAVAVPLPPSPPAAEPQGGSLEETLGSLRRLAAGG